jgi:four helix bundle protein
MAAIWSFRDLDVYRRSSGEATRVFKISCRFPPEERYSLTDQVRRSSRAVAAMIAEAWAHRRYPASFISKLTNARGSD